MRKKEISFNGVKDVLRFSRQADRCDFNIDILYRHFLLDGKSIMALLQMDYTQPLTVQYCGYDPEFEEMLEALVER